MGGTAFLSLTTSGLQATVGLNCTLGQPGARRTVAPRRIKRKEKKEEEKEAEEEEE